MDPQEQFCPNPDCPARGVVGAGNIRVHSWPERRYRCRRCGRTFAATAGTPFHRLKRDAEVVVTVLTLLAHGCPLQAIVAAFGWVPSGQRADRGELAGARRGARPAGA